MHLAIHAYSKKNQEKQEELAKKKKTQEVKNLPQVASSLYFEHNAALGPPYHVIVDTNFINKSIQNKLDILPAMMDCLFAKCKSRHLQTLCERDHVTFYTLHDSS